MALARSFAVTAVVAGAFELLERLKKREARFGRRCAGEELVRGSVLVLNLETRGRWVSPTIWNQLLG